MYYSIDENGHIIESETSDILSDIQQNLYPEFAIETLPVPEVSVSSGDPVLPNDSESFFADVPITYSLTLPDDYITYDDMIELLANQPVYTIYPNQNAVSVFSDVLNGLDRNVSYVIISGSDSNSAYMYYGDDFSISGKDWTISGNVTRVNYFRFRTNPSAAYEYAFYPESTGSVTFHVENELVYTNMVDGYPDIIPYKSRESYSLLFFIPLIFLFSAIFAAFMVRRNHV